MTHIIESSKKTGNFTSSVAAFFVVFVSIPIISNAQPTATPTLITTPVPGAYVLRLNAAGTTCEDSSGTTWLGDQVYSPAGAGCVGGLAAYIDPAQDILGTSDDTLYQSVRYDSGFSYQFDVPNGNYQVRMKFVENVFTSSGARDFSILAQGVTMIPNLDIYSETAARFTALDKIFEVAVSNGVLKLDFIASADNASVCAVEVIGMQSVPSYTATPTLTPGAYDIGLNVAGPAYTDSQNKDWLADQPYSRGGFGYTGHGYTTGIPVSQAIQGTSDEALYRTIRFNNNLEYKFDVPPGEYQVILKFVENTHAAPGGRVFRVSAQGQTIIPALDIYDLAGGQFTALDRTFSVTVTNGTLDIFLQAVSDNAMLCAVRVTNTLEWLTPTPAYSGDHPPSPGECFIYPSPVRGGQASVCCRMAEAGEMRLKIWNEAAELVTEVKRRIPSGVQTTAFSLSGLSSGIYFYAVTLKYDSGRVESIKPQKFAVIR